MCCFWCTEERGHIKWFFEGIPESCWGKWLKWSWVSWISKGASTFCIPTGCPWGCSEHNKNGRQSWTGKLRQCRPCDPAWPRSSCCGNLANSSLWACDQDVQRSALMSEHMYSVNKWHEWFYSVKPSQYNDHHREMLDGLYNHIKWGSNEKELHLMRTVGHRNMISVKMWPCLVHMSASMLSSSEFIHRSLELLHCSDIMVGSLGQTLQDKSQNTRIALPAFTMQRNSPRNELNATQNKCTESSIHLMTNERFIITRNQSNPMLKIM